jgi:hypothetical protein
LWHGGSASDLDDGRANFKKSVWDLGLLVYAGGGSNRIPEKLPKDLDLKVLVRVRIASFARMESKVPECFENVIAGMVSVFWVRIE